MIMNFELIFNVVTAVASILLLMILFKDGLPD